MIESTFDLANPHDNSFGAPDTPQFTNQQPGCNQIGLGLVLEKGIDDDIIKPFTLEEEFSFQEPEISVSQSMANLFDDGNNQQINSQMIVSFDAKDGEFEPVRSTPLILSNHVEKSEIPRNSFNKPQGLKEERAEVQDHQDSQSFERRLNRGARLNLLFLDQQIDEVFPSKKRKLWFNEQEDTDQVNRTKVSFILKYEPDKENISSNESIQSQGKENDQQMNEIAQTNASSNANPNEMVQLEIKPQLNQVIHSSESMVNNQTEELAFNEEKEGQGHANYSEADSLKLFVLSLEQKEQQIEVYKLDSSQADKQNKPQLKLQSQQPGELPVIPEENSTSLNDQSGNSELVANVLVDESTFIRSSVSDIQEQITENSSKQVSKLANKPQQIRGTPASFWEVTIIQKQNEVKRLRRRPCQYWIGESVRYLKNDQVMTCYRRQFEEVFLKLNHPQEVEKATTLFAHGYYMKGSLTMKPRSKINVNPIEGKITVKNSKKNVYFTFNQNEVLISNNRGSKKLCLDNPQIHSIRNSLNQTYSFIVAIQKE